MRRKAMSLKPQEVNPIPEETIRVAHAAFPKGNALMRLRDLLGPIYTDAQFTALFPHDGQPALSPGRLALVSVRQPVLESPVLPWIGKPSTPPALWAKRAPFGNPP